MYFFKENNKTHAHTHAITHAHTHAHTYTHIRTGKQVDIYQSALYMAIQYSPNFLQLPISAASQHCPYVINSSPSKCPDSNTKLGEDIYKNIQTLHACKHLCAIHSSRVDECWAVLFHETRRQCTLLHR